MKEFKGTPGMWIAELQDGINAHDIIVDREDYAWVASVHQQFDDAATPEQAKANAKLIAAAPELLVALRELVDVLGIEWDKNPAYIRSIEIINKALS